MLPVGRPGLLALLAALACGLLATFAACRQATTPPPPARPLRVGLDVWAGYYPLVLAEAKGFLAAEKVSVDIQFPQDTQRMIAEFAARQYDLIGVSLADIILTTRVHPQLRLILQSDESVGGDVILSRAPFSPATLRGQRIGTTLGGFGEFFVRQFLDRHGVAPGEITLVHTDSAAVNDLLATGQIDLGHNWEPYASAGRKAGYTEVFSSRDTPGLILDGIITHTSLIERRTADLQGLVRAWFRAVDWWRQNPAAGNALIEQRLKLAPGSVSLDGLRLLDRAENQRAFGPDVTQGPIGRTLATQVEFFINRGALGRRVLPAEVLDPRFIQP